MLSLNPLSSELSWGFRPTGPEISNTRELQHFLELHMFKLKASRGFFSDKQALLKSTDHRVGVNMQG